MATGELQIEQLQLILGQQFAQKISNFVATETAHAGSNVLMYIIGSVILIGSSSRRPWELLHQVRLAQNRATLGTVAAGDLAAELATSGLTLQPPTDGGSPLVRCFHCGVAVPTAPDATAVKAGHAAASPGCSVTQLYGLVSGSATVRQSAIASADRFQRALRKLARDLRGTAVTAAESFGFSRNSVTLAATRHFMLNGGSCPDTPGALIQGVHDCADLFEPSANLLDTFSVERLLQLLDLGDPRPHDASASASAFAPASSATSAPINQDSVSEFCIVCRHNVRDRVILTCAHFCVCSRCLSGLNNCPVCGSDIVASVKAFIT